MNLIYEDSVKSKCTELESMEDVLGVVQEELYSIMENEPDWWNSRSDPIVDVCSSFNIEGDADTLPNSRSKLVNEIRNAFFESIDS